MPGGHEGRGGTQVRFSDNMEWWCSRPLPRPDLETIPFVGEVAGETPAMGFCAPETRRRDVGVQKYAAGATGGVPTSHGALALPLPNMEISGDMPTAEAVDFLRSQYLGSRQSAPPQRYFPRAWR